MTTPHRSIRLFVAVIVATALVACGGDDDSAADDETTTTEAPSTTEENEVDDEPEEPADDEGEPTDDEQTAAVPGAEADPTATMLGDKAILLDGFFGVRIPEGWSVSTATPIERSVSPPGGETEGDPDAIEQVLVIGPADDPAAATFALLHYSHSDSVPDLARFTEGMLSILGADGTRFTEGQEARIGGQQAILRQLETPAGDNGVLVTLTTGDEYFAIVSIVVDDAYAADAGDLIASVSIEPSAIG